MFWIPRLQFTESWDGLIVHKPETQSILFKDWCIISLCEYAPNKILAATSESSMFIILDFNVAKFIDNHGYMNTYM